MAKAVNWLLKSGFFISLSGYVGIFIVFVLAAFVSDLAGGKVPSIFFSFAVAYLFMALTLLLPFTYAELTLSGEQPLNPFGFLWCSLIVIALIGLLIHLVFRKKIAAWRGKPSQAPSLAAKITALAFIVFIMAVPFVVPFDFF